MVLLRSGQAGALGFCDASSWPHCLSRFVVSQNGWGGRRHSTRRPSTRASPATRCTAKNRPSARAGPR